MKKFFYYKIQQLSANMKIGDNYFLIREVSSDLANKIKYNIISAKTLESAISKLDGTLIVKEKKLRSLTKRELVDRLIERDLAEGFVTILESLPLAEKLRYDASPTISPEYPYIAENLTEICTALGITEEAFKDIFR